MNLERNKGFIMEGNIVKEKAFRIGRTSELVLQYKSLAVMSVYAVVYLIAFYYLEQRDVAVHEIGMEIDGYIPFCEIFIVPYLLWFAYVALTVVFLCIRDKEESDRLVAFLMAGMTIFIVVSAVFPNGHNLRPKVFARDNLFIDLIRHLYATDTPTNILPSIHVFNTVGVLIAAAHSEKLRAHKGIMWSIFITGFLIILSTVFLKQHSVTDVIAAFAMACIIYPFIYASQPRKATKFSHQPI